jgi:hypothetical protein
MSGLKEDQFVAHPTLPINNGKSSLEPEVRNDPVYRNNRKSKLGKKTSFSNLGLLVVSD